MSFVSTENALTSVERLHEFLQIAQEAPHETPDDPPESWPTEGVIDIERLQLRYRPRLPLALDIRRPLRIRRGERLGVVSSCNI